MTDQTQPQTSPPADNRQIDPTTIPQEWRWLYDEMKQARQEAQTYRTERNTLKQTVEQAEQEKLAQQGEWEKLANQRQTELDQAKTQLEAARPYEEALKATNQRRMEAVPKDKQGLIPMDYDPVKLANWLDKNVAILATKPQAPNLNAGEGSTGTTSAPEVNQLTPEELTAARMMGISPENYAKQKKAGKP